MTAPVADSRRDRRTWVIVVLVSVAVAVLGAAVALVVSRRSASPTPEEGARRPTAEQAAIAELVPQAGTRLGAWVQGAAAGADGPAAYTEREQVMGRPVDIVHTFHPFEDPFPTDFERWVTTSPRSLLLSWNGTDAAAILDGTHDDLIRTRARALRDLGVPLYLRFWWEMNTQEKARWAEPDQFVAAWQYVRRLFKAEGADRVAWVWCPTAEAFAPAGGGPPNADLEADRWWPGDAWVDWVCADGYNFAPVVPGAAYRSFAEIFDPFHVWGRRTGKPLMIAEFGALERAPGEKAAWLEDVATQVAGTYDDLGALVYFDSRRRVDGQVRDWRIDTSAASAQSFRVLAADLGDNLRPR